MESEAAAQWGNVASVLGKQLGIMLGTFAVMVIIWVMWLKVRLKGRIYARFFDSTNYEDGELIKVGVADAVPTLQSGIDDLHYLIDVRNQTQMHYPPGLPVMFQEPVQVQHYVRGVNTPYDPRKASDGQHPGTSAAALSNVKNQEYAKTMIATLSDELGGGHLNKIQKIMLMGLVGMGAGLSIIGFMVWETLQQIKTLGGVLGV